jgi:hypothetical protein
VPSVLKSNLTGGDLNLFLGLNPRFSSPQFRNIIIYDRSNHSHNRHKSGRGRASQDQIKIMCIVCFSDKPVEDGKYAQYNENPQQVNDREKATKYPRTQSTYHMTTSFKLACASGTRHPAGMYPPPFVLDKGELTKIYIFHFPAASLVRLAAAARKCTFASAPSRATWITIFAVRATSQAAAA